MIFGIQVKERTSLDGSSNLGTEVTVRDLSKLSRDGIADWLNRSGVLVIEDVQERWVCGKNAYIMANGYVPPPNASQVELATHIAGSKKVQIASPNGWGAQLIA